MLKRSPDAGMAHDYDDAESRRELGDEREKIEIPGSEWAALPLFLIVILAGRL